MNAHVPTIAATVPTITTQPRRSPIRPPARAPADAQRVLEHPGRVARQPDRRLLVVDQAKRLAADRVARLPGADQDLGLEREARGLELPEELLGDGGLVALVAALRVRVVEPEDALHEERVHDARELADGRHVGRADGLRVEAVPDHDVRAVAEPRERRRERVEREGEIGVREDDVLAARARDAAPDRAALPRVLALLDERHPRRHVLRLHLLAGRAAVVDEDQLGAVAEPVAQVVDRLGRRLLRARPLVVERNHQRKREARIGDGASSSTSVRSARLSTLNIGVSGISSRSVRPSGRLKLASSAPTNARSVSSVGGAAGSRGTTKAQPRSPSTASGTPTTAARAIAGWRASSASISPGCTL